MTNFTKTRRTKTIETKTTVLFVSDINTVVYPTLCTLLVWSEGHVMYHIYVESSRPGACSSEIYCTSFKVGEESIAQNPSLR